MGDKEKKKDDEEEEDLRLQYMFSYLFKSFKLKSEKWTKMLANDDHKEVVFKFLDKTDDDVIIFTITPAGQLVPHLDYPPNMKSKSTYFIRREKEPVTKDNISRLLFYGDMSSQPLEEFSVLVDQAWLPFLSNPKNHQGWPQVISDDVIKHIRDIKSVVYEARGRANGEILLPMPVGVERVYEAEMEIIESEGDSVDLYLKTAIEGIVIKWVKQISDVLSQDPTDAFKHNEQPTPMAEIKFWNNRLRNMECIYDQLRDPRVKKMASILELTDSAYFESFKITFRNVVAALAEARDINLFLKPLVKWINAIDSTEFEEVDPLFDPLYTTICLIWSNSRYYCSSTKLINLMKQICNLLIEVAQKFLDPGSLFQGEVAESLAQIRRVINSLELFQNKYKEYRSKVPSFFAHDADIVEWNFHPELIFGQMEKFVERLRLLEDFFKSADDYTKLEKVEIGGLKGKLLSSRAEEIGNEYMEAFTPFQNIVYDPLEISDASFLEDYKIFKEKVDDLDNKLASVFVNAFDDCCNLDAIFKLMNIVGPFMEREIICDAISPKFPAILDMFEKDIDVVKEIFDEHVQYYMVRGHMILDHYTPPTAGAIMWIQKLEKRINRPTDLLHDFEFDIVNNPRAFHILDKKDEMLELLSSLDQHVYTEWKSEVPPTVKRNLKMPLIQRNEESLLLRLNFTREFHAILREVRYLKLVGKTDIPQEAEELYEREGDIRNWIFHLHRIIYWYNQIRVSSHPTEFELISEEIDNIDTLIDLMREEVTWANLDAFDHIKAIHDLVENLHGRLEHAQNNVQKMTDLMLPWSKSPLYERKDEKPENLLALDDRKERVERRYNEVTEVGLVIHKLMKQNYKLFLNIDEPDTESEKDDDKKKKVLFGEDEYALMDEEEGGGELPLGKEVTLTEIEEESEEGETEEEEEEEEEGGERVKFDKETGEAVSSQQEDQSEPAETERKEDFDKPQEGEDKADKPAEGEGEPGKEKKGSEGEPKEGGKPDKPPEGIVDTILDEVEHVQDIGETINEIVDEVEAEGEEVEGNEIAESGGGEVVEKRKKRRKKKKKKIVEEEMDMGSDAGSLSDDQLDAEGRRSSAEAGPPEIEMRKSAAVYAEEGGEGEEEEEGEEEMEEVKPPSLTESEELRLVERREIFNEKWKDYEEYVDGIVSQGLQSAISCSFTLFIEEMDDMNCVYPLFEVVFDLQEPNMVFIPCLDLKDPNGFYALVESLLNDILDMAKLIPRVKKSIEVEVWLERQAELERIRLEEQEEEEEEEKYTETRGSKKGKTEEDQTHEKDEVNTREKGEEKTYEIEEEKIKEKDDPLSEKEEEKPQEKEQQSQEKGDGPSTETGEGETHEEGEEQDKTKASIRESEITTTYGENVEDEGQISEMFEELDFLQQHFGSIADAAPPDNYMEDVEGNVTLCDVATEILCRVQVAIGQAIEYTNKFQEYAYLWLDDRQEFLNQFLKYGHALSPEEEELIGVTYEDGTIALKQSSPSLGSFKAQIDYYEDLHDSLLKIETEKIICRWLRIDVRPFRLSLLNTVLKWSNTLKEHLIHDVEYKLSELEEFIAMAKKILTQDVETMDYDALIEVIRTLYRIKERTPSTDEMFEPIKDTMDMLKTYNVEFPPEVYARLQELPEKWLQIKKIAVTAKQAVAPMMTAEMATIRKKINLFDLRQQQYRDKFRNLPIFKYPCENPYQYLDKANGTLELMEKEIEKLQEQGSMFDITLPDFKAIRLCRKEARLLKTLWDYANVIESNIDEWKQTQWKKIDVDQMESECKKFGKELRGLDKEMRSWETYTNLEATIKNLLTSLRAVTELQNPAIRDRHWQQLMEATKVRFQMDEETTLADLLELKLHRYEDEVKNIVDKSVKEMAMEKMLKELNTTWATMEFTYEVHPRTQCQILQANEELVETLEDNQVQLQNMMNSKYIAYFLDEVSRWQKKLSVADMVIQLWFEVQRTWSHLESVFIGSEDIRSQLPVDSKRFEKINKEFKDLLNDMATTPNVIQGTSKPNLYEKLEEIQEGLTKCEKALTEYLETKRLAFPRFYFVSSADLLDILSNGNQPELVAKHLPKLYDSIAKLKFSQQDGKNTKIAIGMTAKDGEYVDFSKMCDCTGKVEVWLNRLTDVMRETVRFFFGEAVGTYDEKPREQWIFDYPAQVSLCGTQIWWTTEVGMAFSRLEEGYENALKDYQKKQITQLNNLIVLLCGDLSKGDRQKIMTICTIDVHSRDVVGKLIAVKVESSSCFQWQTQLRHRWDDHWHHCFCNICDAQFRYAYEYLGCTPRLVITPLTDRCYITLTQSLHLIMGGAPAGPAGTGKTETTKDLGRAMGIMVYVFNCSEQMDYKSCGNIYKGLAQTGAWGCFDEFNRISVEVLSVVAVQVKTILDAIKAKKTMFNFVGEPIALIPTVGMFITMNPGYAGRTELPENLKALFRPCAMVVPDFELICEIMLVAEGFQGARLLARKFITLYTLCKELLSKQDHYDWGLRAIKSVLVVAGSLKRGDRERPEDQVLMRALRDFNIPKIVTEDVPVFMGLIGDLFPALDVPRKRTPEFESLVKKSVLDLQLQPEDSFVLKIVQLEELLDVRHSVFVIGNAGTGKTMVWRSLFRTYQNQKRKPVYNDLNPKAVTNDELFGVINPSTREWKDGLFSVIMRDQANIQSDGPKWILLDGDIDPMWIESLNTLMDDNKVLTLASNERIALTPAMRLLFEISNLKTATPATVSRAGILYINPQDLGWNPYVTSWIDKRTNQTEKATLIILFDKYVPPCLDIIKMRMKKITPLADVAHLKMLCDLLDCLLTPQNVPNDCPKDWYEIYFVFACIWAFGSTMFQDQLVDYRVEFTKWWTNEFKVVKIPAQGTVFDYVIEDSTKKFVPWSSLVRRFDLEYEIPLQSSLVDTAETTRLRYFMDLLIEKKLPVMLVGCAGSGKSVIIADKLNSLSENYLVTNVPFNFYTTSEMLQKVLEKPLEKKAGRNYGPPGTRTMVYSVDDMNMPEVDTYGTVQPHTLIRQYMDYGHWYDRTKLSLKEIHNCMFISSMNPSAGSFTINPRLQRHFAVFAVNFPTGQPLFQIYNSILSQHLTNPVNKIAPAVGRSSNLVVQAALTLHQKISSGFLPTADKFHYIFNLRDLSNIFQALLFSTAACVPNVGALIRLWVHEATRVYRDKLVDQEDIDAYNKLAEDVVKTSFEEVKDDEIFHTPLIYCHFSEGLGEGKYLPIKSWAHLSRLLEEAMSQYNDLVGDMNLVLFEDAMEHVCRINRIVEGPRGNALLIGVGGRGKQSLSRLAAFIASLEVFQVQLRKGYGLPDLRADLNGLYMKAGMKNTGVMFLMTDSQVADEKFLVVINDLLASGEIPELFADDEIDNIINNIRNEVKSQGINDTRENCWKFFINRVRQMMKVVLCFSPVGSTLRVRARKFPAIVNCTSIDWFHTWPQSALESVSARFLEEIETLPQHMRRSVSLFMAYVHTSVNDMSQLYLTNERRYNYTTPKTFLEQISLYGKLLNKKTAELEGKIVRLENGLDKLASTEKQVDGLKDKLAEQEVVVAEKNEAADKLIQVVGKETDLVSKEKEYVAEEEAKVRVIEEDVSAKQKVCEADLKKAEPALIAAREALNTLNKNNLTELKSFGAPPAAVVNVTSAVLVLFSQKGKIPKDRGWKECKIMMGRVDLFLDNLINYKKENIPPDVVKETKKYMSDPEFNPEKIMSKSMAAAGLCSWVINIIKFHEVYEVVEPKRKALEAANEELASAQVKLETLNAKIRELEDKLEILTKDFDAAREEKLRCQKEADATALTIDLANRLVNGLASENVRWHDNVANYKKSGITLPGDVLLVCAFISYVGCFTRQYRTDLMERNWLPFLGSLKEPIPRTEDIDPLTMLTDDAQIAKWNNEGLPTDRMSAENATILTNSARWPLMIDPQLQGIKWIKQRYGKDLLLVRLGHKNYLDVIEGAISSGKIVLIENIGETVDAVLDPILGRNLVRKGRAIKMGDKEVDYNQNFRLILHTKLANPHYKPEMQAQTTLINFTVTRDGLEEQLLGEVVKAERPDLETLKAELTKQQNIFKITLAELEDDLLARLAAAGEDILSDTALVLNLETTKKTAAEIEVKVGEAKETSIKLDEAREEYRQAAARGSLLYFILNEMYKINPIYQFSLKAFNVVFKKAVMKAASGANLQKRVENLIDNVTFCVFMYTNRGLFERDKLIFMAQMTIQILIHKKEIPMDELDYLLRYPITPNLTSPVEFLTNTSWGGIKSLANMDEFKNLDRDIEGSAKTWKKFVDSECPEKEKFPQEWKNKSPLEKLCMMRALRADRMTYAVKGFIEEKLGTKYTEARVPEFSKSYEETSSSTPVFFILSPGVDPLKDVEKQGRKLGFTSDRRNFHNVSLGQGQEIVAEHAMDVASRKGHWVILQNIHLVARWLPTLEKKMEQCTLKANKKFRLYLSAEPAGDPSAHIIPQGILESSIKITNEPPTGMLANLHKAMDNFTQETLEMSTKEAEFKAILFSLCYFHAVVAERRKFGPQGWNRVYPFNAGDLTISVHVLYNYLEAASQVPWEDLRYLFGEIMYGGHITDDWDRRLCRTYLVEYMSPELLQGDLILAQGFPAPPNLDYAGYHNYIDNKLPPESPYLYGLHPNAEIGFLTTTSEILFRTLFEMQPRDAGEGAGGEQSRDEKVRQLLEDLLDRIPEIFNMLDIMGRTEERTPYIIVAFQECERMNILVKELSQTLHELDLGLKGELTITEDMESLQEALFMDNVPESWTLKAYPSMYTLGPWVADLQVRYKELEMWTGDFALPSSVWLGGFFNPQSFLTAIMQSTARKNEWPLDKMCLYCDVTKKFKDEITAAPREGAYISGLFMEGARWDIKIGSIADAKLKELFPLVPVIFIKAITQDKQELRNMYQCPVYKTRTRGPTFVWTFNLKTKERESKWTLAGVAILLQV